MVAKKDDDIEVLDFFPRWWKEDQEDEYEDDPDRAREILRAKADRLFASLGGIPSGS